MPSPQLLALTLSLLTAIPEAPVKLAAPGFSYVGIEDKRGEFFVDYLAQQFIAQGIRVTTRSEISALVGFERQRQLLGCSEGSTNCLAELAGALGVDGLITGSIARTSRGFAITIKVTGATDGRQLGGLSGRLPDEDALLDWLTEAAKTLTPHIHEGLRRKPVTPAPVAAAPTPKPTRPADAPTVKPAAPPTPAPAPELSPVVATATADAPANPAVWIPAAAGGVCVAGGAVFYLLALDVKSRLDTDGAFGTRSEAQVALAQGSLYQGLAFGLVGLGAAGLAVAGIVASSSSGAPPPPRVSVVAGPSGAFATVQGALP